MLKNHKNLLTIFTIIIAIVCVVLVLSKVKNSSTTDKSEKISVATTYYPLYDFAKNIAGDRAKVTNVTPSGVEPHDYEPSPRDVAGLHDSDVFVFNGAKMETWVPKFVESYKKQAVNSSKGISLIDNSDPHFWLDPVLAQTIVKNIQAGLSAASPKDSEYFNSNAQKYLSKLKQLDDEYKSGLKVCKQRTIVTSHEAFSYLAKRYDINALSIAGISPEEEPSVKKLAELSDLVRSSGIKYVFFESLVSPKLAETVARESGAKTAVFDPIEGLSQEDISEGKDYISIQRDNLAALRIAMDCQ